VLADGRKLVTLRDAATYITKLPRAEQDFQIWQIAVEQLLRALETGDSLIVSANEHGITVGIVPYCPYVERLGRACASADVGGQ